MQELIYSYKQTKSLHHAYFLVGNEEEIVLELKGFVENTVGMKTLGNPDFWYGKFSTLSIDNARDIAESSERMDFSGGKKFFVISADFITIEAQNALLKVFEEPTSGTHFFIISPQDMLLPTLRSRMQTVLIENTDIKLSKSVLSLNMAERLAKVKEITEAISDEDSTKQDAITFLNGIETELYAKGVEKSSKSLETCQKTRESLYDRGAPVKIILENLMLSI